MANRFTNKYNPGKKGKTTEYRNQGYSFEDLYTLKQREESFNKWKDKGYLIPQDQLEWDKPRDQIGAVSSSWLNTLGYSVERGAAVATFKDCNTEFYYEMPYTLFLEWLNSPSKGKWLHDSGFLSQYTSGGNSEKKGSFTKKMFPGNLAQRRLSQAKSRQEKYLAKWR